MVGFMYFLAVVAVLAGIGQLIFPNATRNADRVLAERQGFQSHQGEAYENRRVGSAILLIALGLFIALLVVVAT